MSDRGDLIIAQACTLFYAPSRGPRQVRTAVRSAGVASKYREGDLEVVPMSSDVFLRVGPDPDPDRVDAAKHDNPPCWTCGARSPPRDTAHFKLLTPRSMVAWWHNAKKGTTCLVFRRGVLLTENPSSW